ncbi:MAG: molybdopterin-dependent oxidoreductase [Candidatus Lokiarchaeota archaeon]|nr:molybdopterin-dependent oxidoreductase [Candidatus Harpocratesius repetitus]
MEDSPKILNSSSKISRFATCTKDCYGACVYMGIWDDNKIDHPLLQTIPSKKHPFTQGVFCAKYTNKIGSLYHNSRLHVPLIRQAPKPCQNFKEISFSNAWDQLLMKLKEIYYQHGADKILAAFYSGNTGLLSQFSPLRFFNKIGALITTGGICNEGGIAGLRQMFGTYSLSHPLQITNPETRLLVIWNSDLTNNNNHAHLLVRKAQKNGLKVVVIDSRETKIANQSDFFLKITLNTSHLLAIGIIKQILQINGENHRFLFEHVDNWNSVKQIIEKVDIIEICNKIGVSLEQLQSFASLLVENISHTLFLIGYGTQKDRYGGYFVQFIALIQVVLGNIGKPGAGIIYSLSDHRREIRERIIEEITFNYSHTLNQNNSLEIIKLANILQDHEIKMLFIYNFNPASSLPNQNLLRSVLKREDLFVVVLDCFLNETCAYADLIFPMKMAPETNDLVSSYYMPGLSIIQAGPCPYTSCLSNHEFFNRLGLDFGNQIGWSSSILKQFKISSEQMVRNCMKILKPQQRKEIEKNGYVLFFNPDETFFTDLQFPTSTGKIQLHSFMEYFIHHHELFLKILQKKPGDFYLYTPHHPHFIHSQLGEINSQFNSDFLKVFLNPLDIVSIDSRVGERVKVSNQFGEGIFILEVMPSLGREMALIYSGGPNRNPSSLNANHFTNSIPEILGHSGSYFSGTVHISAVKSEKER